MRKFAPIFAILMIFMLLSCHVSVVNQQKPMQNNSLELYEKYTFQTQDAKVIKMKVLKQDNENIYGKTKAGEDVVLSKINVREAKKVDIVASVAIGLAALAAVIFVPI